MTEEIKYHIRQFTLADKEAYKRIRLESLQEEPAVFSSNYRREAGFEESEWERRLTSREGASFGLYNGDMLIGTTGIFVFQPGEAVMVASYIRRAYRGKGLSALLYTARIDWARAKGLKAIIVSHRQSNLASRAANQHFGFVHTHDEVMEWPDGQQEANVFYRLDLKP